MSSPIKSFVEESCEIGPKFEVERDRLFKSWNYWRDWNGYKGTDIAVFGKHLSAAFPKIGTSRPWKDVEETDEKGNPIKVKKRVYYYTGIRFKPPLNA